MQTATKASIPTAPSAARNGQKSGSAIGLTQRGRVNRRIYRLYSLLCLAVLTTGILLSHAVQTHLRVFSLCLRFSSPQATGFGVRFARHPFREERGIAQTSWGPLTYRLYIPLDTPQGGGLVLLHGIHRLGIEEPRLVNFSRALAAAGAEVMTPELSDLADYRFTVETSDEIGYSAELLSTLMHKSKVGIVGLSFAGGLALLAAAKPQYASRMGFLLTVGAYDDLARVARFLATGVAEMPDGSTNTMEAHEYGALVVAYSHAEDFFPERDVPAAREALKAWLSEMPDQSRDAAMALSAEGRERLDQLLYHREKLRKLLLQSTQAHANELAAVSPSGHLQELTVPTYVLHATGDDVIPASEALWLSREIPKTALRKELISPAIIHADVAEKASILRKWQLLHFLARILNNIDELGASN